MINLACKGSGVPLTIKRMAPQTSNKRAPYHGPPIICWRCEGAGWIWSAERNQAGRCSNSTCPTIVDGDTFERWAKDFGQLNASSFPTDQLRPSLREWVADLIANGVSECPEYNHG